MGLIGSSKMDIDSKNPAFCVRRLEGQLVLAVGSNGVRIPCLGKGVYVSTNKKITEKLRANPEVVEVSALDTLELNKLRVQLQQHESLRRQIRPDEMV